MRDRLYILKLQLAYIYQDYEQALTFAQKAQSLLASDAGLYYATELVFYTCLALTGLYLQVPTKQQKNYRNVSVGRVFIFYMFSSMYHILHIVHRQRGCSTV